MIDRRCFVRRASGSLLGSWLLTEIALDSVALGVGAPPETAGGFRRLVLRAGELDPIERFYARTIGWSCRRDDDGALVIRAGMTELVFEPHSMGARPHYHVAWAIPCNKFKAAKRWLAERTPLLRNRRGEDEFHFRSANRRGVYFSDPAGNVMELIARDDVGNERPGPFRLDDILFVNHAGLVANDVDGVVRSIRAGAGLEPTASPQPNFVKLGDANRHIVVVPSGRPWIPERVIEAGVYPATFTLLGQEARAVQIADHPYAIDVVTP